MWCPWGCQLPFKGHNHAFVAHLYRVYPKVQQLQNKSIFLTWPSVKKYISLITTAISFIITSPIYHIPPINFTNKFSLYKKYFFIIKKYFFNKFLLHIFILHSSPYYPDPDPWSYCGVSLWFCAHLDEASLHSGAQALNVDGWFSRAVF